MKIKKVNLWGGALASSMMLMATAFAATTYYAYCNHDSHDGTGGWKGAVHSDAQKARDDCATHKRSFPGHSCFVQDEHR